MMESKGTPLVLLGNVPHVHYYTLGSFGPIEAAHVLVTDPPAPSSHASENAGSR